MKLNNDFYKELNLNKDYMDKFDEIYHTEYRVLRSIHETQASISGYFHIAKCYVNKSNQVCWFETILSSGDEPYVKVNNIDISLWQSAENNHDGLPEFHEHMKNIMNAFNYDSVFVMDYVKGGKYYDLSLKYFLDKNLCLYYPLSNFEVEKKIPSAIY